MEILKYCFVFLFIVGGLLSIQDIGKPRAPKTSGDVIMGLILTGLLVLALLN